MKAICFSLFVVMFLSSTMAYGASARCEVVKKEGSVLIMDCGEQAKGFNEKSQVKIKTDRDSSQKDGR
jgi:hypothetical protein